MLKYLIGFFLATQYHSKNNASVHGFWILFIYLFIYLFVYLNIYTGASSLA